MPEIRSFSGAHRWLSNFWPCPIRLGGALYPSTEAAFQAAKTLDGRERAEIAAATSPGSAKRLGRKVTLRADWEQIKLDVMRACIEQKFAREPLRSKLLATGDAELVEDNTWGDRYWGVCDGRGENHLGRLLMVVRANLRQEPLSGPEPELSK